MIEEQERQDNVQKLVEDCIEEFRASGMKYSELWQYLASGMKTILKNKREWVRKSAIKGIQ